MSVHIRFALLLALFTLSGFSGLVYESIWTHYLKLYLGHAAYAQTLVLAIFMGGMAIGAAACGKFSQRLKKPLIIYAVLEGILGVLGLLFHDAYTIFLAVSFNNILPAIENTMLIHLAKWICAALLILPQCILLGATFPLLSAGVIRGFSRSPGASLSCLYFSNSLGGAAGVIVSGFVLIKYVGLPGTLLTAGLINILVALSVWALFKDVATPALKTNASEADTSQADKTGYRLLLLTALVTGAASFIYEIIWIRMLSLVLGSSSHAFELMLSAFIFGLAFGGIWIRKRIDGFEAPLRALAWIQILMGLCAVTTLFFYNQTFEIMRFVMMSLSKNESGYIMFNILSHAICYIIMLPATFCAGMTLPLITYILLKNTHGEKVIGTVYAFNTLGAIIGIIVCVHLGMWFLGLKGSMILAAALDTGMGIVILIRNQRARDPYARCFWSLKSALPVAYAALALVLLSPFIIHFDAVKMTSGVFRSGLTQVGFKHIYHVDGKTATVDLNEKDGYIILSNNGKGDASISRPGTRHSPDETTQVLLGALPLLYVNRPKNAAVIGMGLGMTSHTLLHNRNLDALHTIEIEKGVAIAASLIRPRNERLFADARSHIHIEDAKTFFTLDHGRYDIIVSEPSNPWVSGISGLFSTEFYRLISTKLSRGGVFSQWIQLYEINDALIATIIKAMLPHFSDIRVYFANSSDMVVLAKTKGMFGDPKGDMFDDTAFHALLENVGIRHLGDISKRFGGDREILEPFINQYPIAANSDYFPVLDQLAVRSRFFRDKAVDLQAIANDPLPIVDTLSGRLDGENSAAPRRDENYAKAWAFYMYLMHSDSKAHEVMKHKNLMDAEILKLYMNNCKMVSETRILSHSIHAVGIVTVGRLTPRQAKGLWSRIKAVSCHDSLQAATRQSIELFLLQAGGQHGEAADMAAKLLNLKTKGSARQLHILNSALLGYIMENRLEDAGELWRSVPAGAVDFQASANLRLLLSLLTAESRKTSVTISQGN